MPFWNSVPALTLVSLDDPRHNTYVIPPHEYGDILEQRGIPPLLPQFEWFNLDVHEPLQMKELFDLLYSYYVEDSTNRFRLYYDMKTIEWLLCPPGYVSDWHIGVRMKSSKKLVAFISAIPCSISLHGERMESTEVNFLCIHPKLRTHHLAPLLIQEVTRRIALKNRWTSVYTTGTQITKPLVMTTLYHRSLNTKKLVNTKFTELKAGVSVASMSRLYTLPAETIRKWRRLEEKDLLTCWEIFNRQTYTLMPVLTLEEFRHWLLPTQSNIVSAYVLEVDNRVTDFLSYYLLSTTVIGTTTTLLGAYIYYSGISTLTSKEMIQEALILAKQEGCDVFTCMDIMDYEGCLKDLKFTLGTGRSHYYVYNWICAEIAPKDVGLILM